jgi:Asp-tRNA(Asn)/Glu-tRNA(Gln) amidotransferase A subunit family amidase
VREQLAAAVRQGRIDPVALVEESVRRIDAHNGTLNAVISLRAEEARAEAAASPRSGPLAGFPVLVKDLARCRGTVTTLGSPWYADAPPDEIDDVVVARLKSAGAIVIGKSNTPAFGHAAYTDNRLFGPTRNPWNPDRSPGGSSGGSAAALAAGLVPLATSSDGGGSVRIPASCCGLVGYKPTMGAIGRNLLPRWVHFSSQGAMASSVADVILEASVTFGLGRGDWLSFPAGTIDLVPARPREVLATRSFRADLDPEIEAEFEASLTTLSEAGFPVHKVAAPSDRSVAAAWATMAAAELAQSLAEFRDRWDELEPALRDQVQFGSTVSAEDYIRAQRLRHEVTARFDDLLGTDSVLVVPTANVVSWPPEGPLPTSTGTVRDDAAVALNTPDLNFTGHPAVSVPLGRDHAGVPFGLQIVAPRFADSLALGLAQVLEQRRPWPLVADGYSPFTGLD